MKTNAPYYLAVSPSRHAAMAGLSTVYPMPTETAALAAESMLAMVGLWAVILYLGYDY